MPTIKDLKRELGAGLRKNRFMVEIPVPIISGETLNILCKTANFPERNIMAQQIWHKGREYNIRGETNYGSEFELTFLDNEKMDIRRFFDTWLIQIDNTNPPNTGILGASFEKLAPGLLSTIEAGVELAGTIKNIIQNPKQLIDFTIAQIDPGRALSTASYQTDVNIWQIDHNNSPVYGYKMQNAWPKRIGMVNYNNEEQNTLSEFNVVFAFSEFIPIHNTKEEITRLIIGDKATNIVKNLEEIF